MRPFLRPKVFLVVSLVFFSKIESEICFSLHRCHLRLNYINVEYYIIIPQNQNRTLINEILVQFTYLVGMIADQNFYDICFTFFILRLRLRSTAEGRSFSEPNIRLRPKVKIASLVQHCNSSKTKSGSTEGNLSSC